MDYLRREGDIPTPPPAELDETAQINRAAQLNEGDILDHREWPQLPPPRDTRVYRFLRDPRRITLYRIDYIGGIRHRIDLGPGIGFAIHVQTT